MLSTYGLYTQEDPKELQGTWSEDHLGQTSVRLAAAHFLGLKGFSQQDNPKLAEMMHLNAISLDQLSKFPRFLICSDAHSKPANSHM